MEGKRYLVVLLVVALVGATAGGATLAVQSLVNSGNEQTRVQSPSMTQTTTMSLSSTVTTTTEPSQTVVFPVNGNSTSGIVKAVNDSIITITKTDGTMANIMVGQNTIIQKLSTASISGLAVGTYITVKGGTGQDGSVQATEVTIITQPGNAFPQGTTTAPSRTFTGTPTGQGTGLPQSPGSSLPGSQATSQGTSGTIKTVDGSTISLKTQNGSTVNVVVSDTTRIRKESRGSLADVTAGSSITALCTTQSDGSLLATNITLDAR